MFTTPHEQPGSAEGRPALELTHVHYPSWTAGLRRRPPGLWQLLGTNTHQPAGGLRRSLARVRHLSGRV